MYSETEVEAGCDEGYRDEDKDLGSLEKVSTKAVEGRVLHTRMSLASGLRIAFLYVKDLQVCH